MILLALCIYLLIDADNVMAAQDKLLERWNK